MASMTLDALVSQLEAAHGSELVTVVLYGSAAAGEHIPKRSDYNVLVLLRTLTLERLDSQAAIARAWGEAGNPPPLTLTEDEWRASSDIFPMEYSDIIDRHKVLSGTPPFDGIQIDPRNLRLQLEHEAMGKLIQLRQGVLAAGRDEKRLLELLARSLSTMMVIFRAVQRLHHERPSTDYDRLSRDVAGKAGFDPGPFAAVIGHVRGDTPLRTDEARTTLAGYLSGLQRLVAYLDQMELPSG